VLALLLLQLTACGFSGERQAAERVAQRYFTAFAAHDVEAALALYSPVFFQKTPQDQWRRTLEQVWTQFGPITGHVLLQSGMSRSLGNGASTRVELVFSVQHEHGETTERLVLAATAGGALQIIEHSITSAGRDLTPAPQESIAV
jgi:hypothetical protein